jgi:hypothetical protein
VYRAVPQPSTDHAGADKVSIRAFFQEFDAALRRTDCFAFRSRNQCCTSRVLGDAVHLGAGVAQTSHDLFEPTRGGGHERGVAGSLPSPAIRARTVLKQQIHQCEVTVFRG